MGKQALSRGSSTSWKGAMAPLIFAICQDLLQAYWGAAYNRGWRTGFLRCSRPTGTERFPGRTLKTACARSWTPQELKFRTKSGRCPNGSSRTGRWVVTCRYTPPPPPGGGKVRSGRFKIMNLLVLGSALLVGTYISHYSCKKRSASVTQIRRKLKSKGSVTSNTRNKSSRFGPK